MAEALVMQFAFWRKHLVRLLILGVSGPGPIHGRLTILRRDRRTGHAHMLAWGHASMFISDSPREALYSNVLSAADLDRKTPELPISR